jgi:hypothetical protein
LILKGKRIFIPRKMRKDLLQKLHMPHDEIGT